MGCTLCCLSKNESDRLGGGEGEENKRIIQFNQWKSTGEGAGSLGKQDRPCDKEGISVTCSEAVF